jgi:1-phosphofructokinase
MIVTLTPNPSIDRTIELSERLERGGLIRSTATHDEAGGKGVNVARVVRMAGLLAVAVLPGDHDDPLLSKLRELHLTHRAVPTGQPSRINLTFAEPDGVTTKINAPGHSIDPAHLTQLIGEVSREAVGARWAVLSGSLPPGVGAGWYVDVIEELRGDGLRIALDTSGEPLKVAVERAAAHLDLIKPNSEELSELVGTPAAEIEADLDVARASIQPLLDRGIAKVLLTLGSKGALLATQEGTWFAAAPAIKARSTVGAGDSALAGYLIGDLSGLDEAKRLSLAVAYGSAAASLPGSRMPEPGDLPSLPEAQSMNPHRS